MKPLSAEEQDLVDWVNAQLIKSTVPMKSIRNLDQHMRSGVVLIRLVEILTNQKRSAWEEEPRYLWQFMKNATALLNFISCVTFEPVPSDITARGKAWVATMITMSDICLCVCAYRYPDIVSMKCQSMVSLLNYLRDKFDLDFLFQKVLNEELKDEEIKIHMHVTTQVDIQVSEVLSSTPEGCLGSQLLSNVVVTGRS